MIVVTGATGHVGNVLIRELTAAGERVRAMVLPNDDCRALAGLEVERVTGNVLEPASLDRALAGADTVYHLAGIISIVPGAEELMRKVNVEGVRNTAQAALRAGVRRLVHVSSIHAFERVPHGVVIDERVPLVDENPVGVYDKTKADGTRALLRVVEAGLDAVVVCPTGVIGPHDYLGSEMGNLILNFARKKLHVTINGAYDFVDVRDVAQGLMAAAARGRKGELYILSGARIEILQIKQMVQDMLGIHSPHLILPPQLAEGLAVFSEWFYRLTHGIPQLTRYSLRTLQDNCHFSHAKAREELGYAPRPLAETFRDILAWRKSLEMA